MMTEEAHLQELGVTNAFSRTTIDENALVITPFHRAVNRLRELARGNARHGSCGMGIGETMVDTLTYGDRVLRVGDLRNLDRLYEKLTFLRSVNQEKIRELESQFAIRNSQFAQELEIFHAPNWADWLMEAYQDFAERAQIVEVDHLKSILQRKGSVVFEGAQGVLLDEWLGFHPHTTWSTITLANADALLREANYQRRSHTNRHHAWLCHRGMVRVPLSAKMLNSLGCYPMLPTQMATGNRVSVSAGSIW